MVSLLKSSPPVDVERLGGPCRTKLWRATVESWSLNHDSKLTGCSCGKNGMVIAARAPSFADVFAISASYFKRDSSCFGRNFFSSRTWRFSSMAVTADGWPDLEFFYKRIISSLTASKSSIRFGGCTRAPTRRPIGFVNWLVLSFMMKRRDPHNFEQWNCTLQNL